MKLAAAALAAPAPAGVAPRADRAPLQLPYTQFTLPNGLHVILHEDHSVPVVTVNVWYHVGSGRERHGPHRLRASVRAPDVHGIGPRQAGRIRLVARRRRRPEQRLDRIRPHELLDQRAVERARARVVPRVRSHGLSARLDDAADRRRAARRREERTAPERREPAVRHRRRR